MKLDYDCMRDIMLTIEEMSYNDLLNELNYKKYDRLESYSRDVIAYTLDRMLEAGFLPASSQKILNTRLGTLKCMLSVKALTWEGHQYLDSVRSQSRWNKVKEYILSNDGLPANIIVSIANKIIDGSI